MSSNNGEVVPNDPSVFTETASGNTRVFEIYGLSAKSSSRPGTAIIEAKRGRDVVAHIQVQVFALDGKRAFFELDPPQMALNASDTPVPYKMKYTQKYGSSADPSAIIADVVARRRLKHLTFSCHGTALERLGGPKIFLGTGFTLDNVELWSRLHSVVTQVIWMGSCAIAGTDIGRDFCKQIAKRTGCYLVSAAYTVPPAKPGINQVEVFSTSMPQYFASDGTQIKNLEFLKLYKQLGFRIVKVQR